MKTAFKRVALVAAAALAIGGISAVSAQATATPQDLTVTTASIIGVSAGSAPTYTETATQIAGPANYVTVTEANANTYVTVTGGTFVGGTASAVTASTNQTLNVATPTAGTITVNSYPITSGVATTTANTTVTITVVSALPGTVYGSSAVYANSGIAVGNSTTDSAFSVTAASGAGSVANFDVTEKDANGVALTAGYVGITATATNGLLTSTGGITTPSGTTYIAGTPTTSNVNFVLSGLPNVSGTSVVTISVNGVVVKTYSVTFTGTAVKLVLTAINNVIAVGTPAGVTANTNALEVQEFDANGNAVAVTTAHITVTPASASIATAGAFDNADAHTLGNISGGTATTSSVVGVSLNGVAAGTTTFTATDSSLSLTSGAVSVRASSATPTSVVYSTDSSSYAAGAAGKLIITVSDAAGTLPAGAYTLATGAATSSLAFAVAPSNLPAAVTLDDTGVSSASFNAPLSDGTVTVGGTSTTGTGAVTVTPVSFTVTSGASDAANAATDAANEATDAANAATDAANAAADSADAATAAAQDAGDKADAALAAVTALSQQVTTLLAKVAALAATIAKIAKKVKA